MQPTTVRGETRVSSLASPALAASLVAGLIASIAPRVAASPEVELAGEVALESRQFPEAPASSEQNGAAASPSLAVEPELTLEWSRGDHVVTVRPFVRIDAHDDSRTHADVREASWLMLGSRWSLLVGAAKVFWGVTESRHLVDIVNQTDGVEDVDGEDKLGQPMVNVTLEGSWGALDLFYLPYFRERTFPGDDARLRGAWRVGGRPVYESSRAEWHPDVAVRWASSFGDLDVGLSHFHGTSREPRLVPEGSGDGAFLRPHYDVVDQTGLELQLTKGTWLWKLEAIRREGHGESFGAAVVGFERTFFGLGPGAADLGVVGELLVDDRDARSPVTVFDHDVFVGLRWAFNDVNDTSLLAGPIIDYETGETLLTFEAERRLSRRFKMEVEARWFVDPARGGPIHGLRRDRHVTLRLTRFL